MEDHTLWKFQKFLISISVHSCLNCFFAMNMLERITIIPDLCNGEPTIRGMRVTVKAIVEYIAAGETKESLLKAYPHLSDNDINAAVEYASGHLL